MKYGTAVDPRTGRVIRAGLNPGTERSERDTTPLGSLYRAIVLKTYSAVDPSRKTGGRSGTSRTYEVECDILLARSLVPLSRVPVMQKSHSVSDADLWFPRPCTRVVGSVKPLNFARVSERGSPESMPPGLEEIDGDIVLVQFIEGDNTKPVIVGALAHPSTKRKVIDGPGWQELASGNDRGTPQLDEKYMRFRGVELRINDQGDVLVDTVDANPIEPEAEAPNPLLGGKIRLRLKGTQRFTIELDGTDILEVYKLPGLGPQVDLIEASTEAFVRGTTFVANLQTFLIGVKTFATTGVGAATGPMAPLAPIFTALGVAVDAFASTLTPGVTLSTKIRGD